MASGFYFPPSYFPPVYFFNNVGGVVSPVATTTLPYCYNTPSYFPPSYFPGSTASSAPTPLPGPAANPAVNSPLGMSPGSFEALVASIQATGAFDEVIFGDSTQRSRDGADRYPLAVVTPSGWEESDETDPTLIARKITFKITVVVKTQDAIPQYNQLDLLAWTIKSVIDRSDLNGTALPSLTRIKACRYEQANPYPEQSIDLEGEFSLIVDPLALPSNSS